MQEADSARSESMDPMFALMGLGWMLRKIAGSIKAVSTYTHDKGGPGRAPSLRISAVTSMGTDVKVIALTGKPQELKGGDGKVSRPELGVLLRASSVCRSPRRSPSLRPRSSAPQTSPQTSAPVSRPALGQPWAPTGRAQSSRGTQAPASTIRRVQTARVRVPAGV